jgi:hypothetical protein
MPFERFISVSEQNRKELMRYLSENTNGFSVTRLQKLNENDPNHWP